MRFMILDTLRIEEAQYVHGKDNNSQQGSLRLVWELYSSSDDWHTAYGDMYGGRNAARAVSLLRNIRVKLGILVHSPGQHFSQFCCIAAG